MFKKRNYYEVLGVQPNATQEEVKRSFRELSQVFHPDVGGSLEKQQEIAEAYNTLKDPEQRRIYDNKIDNQLSNKEKTQTHNPQDDDFDQEMWEWEQEVNGKKAA